MITNEPANELQAITEEKDLGKDLNQVHAFSKEDSPSRFDQ